MTQIITAGQVPYLEADSWQRELARKRSQDQIADTLILLEHPPTITLGKRECAEDLKFSAAYFESLGIPVVKTDRGGRATYHGPGQLVGYFIVKIGQKPIPTFVREIEELLIRLLRQFDIVADRDPNYPGVWVGQRKIAALGLHVERGVTRHGFALNLDPNLKHFELIYPCGIQDRKVTSIRQELGAAPSRHEIEQRITSLVQDLFPTPRG